MKEAPTIDKLPPATDKAEEWNSAYLNGVHRAKWDHVFPSPELVGFMFASGRGSRMRVLEVGCGTGRDAIFLAQCGHEVHALDLSEEALRIAAITPNRGA